MGILDNLFLLLELLNVVLKKLNYWENVFVRLILELSFISIVAMA